MEKYVFISYSSGDKGTVDELYVFLQNHGIRCWMAPYSIQPGKSFAMAINDAIQSESCAAFVLIMSANSNRSEHARNEVNLAVNYKKPIIAFRLNNDFALNGEFAYNLGRRHWIDASLDFDGGLDELLEALRAYTENCKIEPGMYDGGMATVQDAPAAQPVKAPVRSREEIAAHLKELSRKFSYSIVKRIRSQEDFDRFDKYSKKLFSFILSGSYKTALLPADTDYVELLVEKLSAEEHIFRVHGLPGGAKNLLLQLAFFKMLDAFVSGKSDALPVYLSSGYYEKFDYAGKNVDTAMVENIQKDLSEYFAYLSANKNVKPVLLLEGVREYTFARIFPEKIIAELFKPYGNYSRAITIDTGLIHQRSRMKKVIGIAGEPRGDYLITSSPVPVEEEEKIKEMIGCVSGMYCERVDENKLYELFKRLGYPAIDVFLIRFVAHEMNASDEDIVSVSDMYERFILSDYQDEDRLYQVSRALYRYTFFGDQVQANERYDGKIWAFPNKHFTYLSYLIAYYFVRQIEENDPIDGEYEFFTVMLTSTANQFIESMFKDNYPLQKTFISFVDTNYARFDMRQKCNAAYLIGKMDYNNNLRDFVAQFLIKQFDALAPAIRYNNRKSQENLDNHLLLRAISYGLLFCEQMKYVDEYIRTVITNDVANAVNRGVLVEYYGEGYQMGANNTYNLDTNPNRGESAIKTLCARIEATLVSDCYKFIELDLVSLLTLLQARVESDDVQLNYDVKPYVLRAIDYIAAYKKKPQNVVSAEIPCYFDSVNDDFLRYKQQGCLDIATLMYNRLQHLQYIKRVQWFNRVGDPESVAEHSFNSWLLAMLFLPEEDQSDGYDKHEILDMLLIHDMALSDTHSAPDMPAVTHHAKGEDVTYLRKLFLKGTYPFVANLTHSYDLAIKYFNRDGVNAMIAHDINIVQTTYMFFEYAAKNALECTDAEITEWLQNKGELTTRFGHELFERLITYNAEFYELFARIGK